MFLSFLLFLCIAALILWAVEPQITSFRDGIWYGFVAATTIGFGDICVETDIGRILTVFIGVYGIMVVAMIPGVIVSYYLDYLKIRENTILSAYREKLECLPELSREELVEISEKIKNI